MADIVVPAAIAVALVGGAWAAAWAVVRVAAANARVKQDMLARGLSVEEMERLLNPPAIWIKPVKPGAARHSVEEDIVPLLDRELSTNDIERLLKLLPGFPPLSVEEDVVPLLDREMSVDDIERVLRLRRSLTNGPPPAEEAPVPTEAQTGFRSAEPRKSL
jgi:hypothetical protein